MTKRRRRSEQSPADILINIGVLLIFGMSYVPEYLRGKYFSGPAAASLGWIAMGIDLALVLIVVFVIDRINSDYNQRKLMTVDNLQTLSPSEFEQYVAGVFAAKGFRTSVSGRTGDGGVDINLEKGDLKAIVQCKRYRRSVGVEEIREFSDVANRAEAQRAYFVTTSEFTSAAVGWARDNPKIKLIDNHALYSLMQDSNIGPFSRAKTVGGLHFARWQWLALALLAECINSAIFILLIYIVNRSAPGN